MMYLMGSMGTVLDKHSGRIRKATFDRVFYQLTMNGHTHLVVRRRVELVGPLQKRVRCW